MTAPWTPPRLDLPRFTEPALCAQVGGDLFHPDRGNQAHAAKRLCARCPARPECLAYALSRQLIRPWDGIWAGTSPKERRAMLRRRPEAGAA